MIAPKLQAFPSLRAAVGAALGLCACASMAQLPEPAGSGFRISGFGTLGIVHADAPAGWGFLRDVNQPENSGGTRADIDSRLGLQINYAPSAQVELVGQVIAARKAPTAKASDALEWAFAAYRPNDALTLRGGRLSVDQFLMSDYRNVGFAYLFARPPVEFYAVLPTSLDGVDAAWTWNTGGAQWRAKVFGGSSKTYGIRFGPLVGLVVSRQADGLLLRAGLTRTKIESSPASLQPLLDGLGRLSALPVADVAAQAAALRTRLNFAGGHAQFATLGMSYDHQNWQWAVELMRVSGHPTLNFAGGYVGLGRRFGPVTVFGLASGIESLTPPAETPAWGAALAPALGPANAQQAQLLGEAGAFAANGIGLNQRALSLGVRWDVRPQIALKVQWDHVRIGTNGGLLWFNSTLNSGRADVGTVVLDFVF